MFGLLRPCAHSAARHGIDPSAWHTHLCGLCLGLRDGHGQLARAATNTDAIVLEILTEAQQSTPAARTAAGPCALRGMRRASVVAADAPGVRLAATASLLLAAAKIRDHMDDGETARLTRRPLNRVSNCWQARARSSAAPLGLDIEPLITAIESQLRLENSPESTLDDLTAPTQLCAAELFAHTAILADRPENTDALREAGWHFGRIAHLADALEDLDADRAQGHFNPLIATGTTPERAHSLVAESNSLLRAALARVALDRIATIRWSLLDPLRGVVRELGRTAGIAHTCATGACRTRGATTAAGATDPPSSVVTDLVETRPGMFEGGGRSPAAHGQQPWQPGAPFTPQPGLEPPEPPQGPNLLQGLGILCTQYCTGYACCATHTRPCSGQRKDAWINRCDCDCSDCCDCDCCDCDGCGGCCDCGGCDCGCDC
ncbi:DUF5685 family protein [Nocardia sp. CDC160]|uniref:DUF5685 family protein n=1 Tax=Nocardia sp. CDC160 TaxID=3112166 RepID=UPI002DB76F06|nr:DUF5685 family protein [Nocardia sp. CDC160]MEC3914384.1 DUF5685 family protein [Nocardia sp. CDC160]